MNKALFLDRDGVINRDTGYIFRSEDFVFNDEIVDLCRKYQNEGYLIIVITNQSGIARGFYTEDDFLNLNNWMIEEFRKKGITITSVYYCPHHVDYGDEKYRKDCRCRKPNPGMILDAQKDFDIDLAASVFIGDKESDIQAGRNAGVGKLILMETFR